MTQDTITLNTEHCIFMWQSNESCLVWQILYMIFLSVSAAKPKSGGGGELLLFSCVINNTNISNNNNHCAGRRKNSFGRWSCLLRISKMAAASSQGALWCALHSLIEQSRWCRFCKNILELVKILIDLIGFSEFKNYRKIIASFKKFLNLRWFKCIKMHHYTYRRVAILISYFVISNRLYVSVPNRFLGWLRSLIVQDLASNIHF